VSWARKTKAEDKLAGIDQEIARAEERLRNAMLHSDVAALDALISDDLVFTNHLGQLLTKKADLETHRSGMLKFNLLEPSEQLLQVEVPLAIVSVRMKLSGSYDEQPFAAELRYTRIWRRANGGEWQVVAGHSSGIQG
jgi:ketosteroid isomerase-like protein